MREGVMKSVESAFPARLSSPCWCKAGRGPNGGRWEAELKRAEMPTLCCCRELACYWGNYSFTAELWGWMGLKYFVCLPQMSAYLGRNSTFLAPGPKPAGGWDTCWVRVGGLITGWQKWYSESVQLLQLNEKRHWWTMCLLPENTKESVWLYSKATLDLISIQTFTPKSLGWGCCDFCFMQLDSYSLLYILT